MMKKRKNFIPILVVACLSLCIMAGGILHAERDDRTIPIDKNPENHFKTANPINEPGSDVTEKGNVPDQTPQPAPERSDIGEAAAKVAAFSHAGVAEQEVTGLRIEREFDHGVLEYEVDFRVGSMEYDYTVKAADGTILKAEQEAEREKPIQPAPQPETEKTDDIGKASAGSAALKHAGFSETEVTGLRVEKDYDDGRLEYEVDFRVGRTEYDYTIDGRTGKVLEYEKDLDD